MNDWQVIRFIRWKLANATWAGGANTLFGDRVYPLEDDTADDRWVDLFDIAGPAAEVRLGRIEVDGNDPQLLTAEVLVHVALPKVDDPTEAEAHIGDRTDYTASTGRSIHELAAEVRRHLRYLGPQSGVRLLWRGFSEGAPGWAPFPHGASRTLVFQARILDQPNYPAPKALLGTDQGGGSVDLTWVLAPDRHDRDAVILRRAAGSTAPSSVTDGTGVTLGGDLVSSVTDSPGPSATFSYALFMRYDESRDQDGSELRYSSAATLTITMGA